MEGSFEFDRQALSPACSQLLDNPPRHDILWDPCYRCTVFVNSSHLSEARHRVFVQRFLLGARFLLLPQLIDAGIGVP